MFRQFGGGKGPTENSWNTKIQSHPAPWRCKNYMVFPMLRVIFVTKILTRLLLYFWCLLWQIFLGFFCWQKMMFPSRGCWKKKRYTQNFPSKNVIWKLTQLPVSSAGLKKITNRDPVWIFMLMSYCNSVSLENLRLDAIQMKWLSSWWPLNIPAPKVHEKLSFSVRNHWPFLEPQVFCEF